MNVWSARTRGPSFGLRGSVTRPRTRSSTTTPPIITHCRPPWPGVGGRGRPRPPGCAGRSVQVGRSEEHTSELQSRQYLVCRLLLEKKKYVKKRTGLDVAGKTLGLQANSAVFTVVFMQQAGSREA